MRKTVTTGLAFLTLAALAGTAMAQERGGPRGDGMGRMEMRFERADTDDSGDISFEEFAEAMEGRIGGADANGDGKLTVAEIADEIQRRRSERAARRIIERFDTDGDGELTLEEVESRQRKMFALMDRNDDGKLERSEMPRRMGRHGKFRRGHDRW